MQTQNYEHISNKIFIYNINVTNAVILKLIKKLLIF